MTKSKALRKELRWLAEREERSRTLRERSWRIIDASSRSPIPELRVRRSRAPTLERPPPPRLSTPAS